VDVPEVAISRKQRLRTLENIIRDGMEKFVATGFALKEIRDDLLYREDGFDTWDAYLKERVDEEFGIEERWARKLIVSAQVRPKLPDRNRGSDSDEGWTAKATYEFARLAPKDEETPGQPFDLDRLDKRDVQRVAKKVIEHCEKEEIKPTSTIVRKFVDEELGIDRAARAKETKEQQQEEELESRDFGRALSALTGILEAEIEKLEAVPDDWWKQIGKQKPVAVKRLIAASERLTELVRKGKS
jgi:hypothetical protein